MRGTRYERRGYYRSYKKGLHEGFILLPKLVVYHAVAGNLQSAVLKRVLYAAVFQAMLLLTDPFRHKVELRRYGTVGADNSGPDCNAEG